MQRSLLLLAAIAAVTPLEAQRGRGGNPGDVFRYLTGKYDKNADGKVTLAEYARGEDKFKGYDRNGDGVITEADFAGGGGGRRRGNRGGGNRRGGATQPITGPAIAETLATNADSNADGKVTKLEWQQVLNALDGNQDGIAGAEELNGIMCAALGRKQLSTRAITRRARHLDVNKDGKVQLGELGAMFAKLDTNKDQLIDSAELGAAKPIVAGQPQIGDVAPDFTLPTVKDAKQLVTLSSFKGKKPVALIFGSYT